jgi:hypothetical protein
VKATGQWEPALNVASALAFLSALVSLAMINPSPLGQSEKDETQQVSP